MKTPILKLFYKGSPENWDHAKEPFFDFNKTIITLSSSVLVLSFSLIKIKELEIDKGLIGLSWTAFLLTIFCGVIILYLQFVYKFTDSLIKQKADEGKYFQKTLLDNEEIVINYLSLTLIYFISLIELASFFIAFCILMFAAFNSF